MITNFSFRNRDYQNNFFDNFMICDKYERLLNYYTNQVFYSYIDENDYLAMKQILLELNNIIIAGRNLKPASGIYYSDSEREKWLQKYNIIPTTELHPLPVIFNDEGYITNFNELFDERISYCKSLQLGFWGIIEQYEKQCMPDTFAKFIKKNTSLLHLVHTNNASKKIKLHAVDSFKLLCHFHVEKIPSMSINLHSGTGYCYGCGISFSVIDYLMQKEKINQEAATKLLRDVYLININNNAVDMDNPLIQKYRTSLLSDDYYALLKRSFERTSNLADCYQKRLALQKYQNCFSQIERVKVGETLYYYKENPKAKVLTLEMPNFN